MRLGVGAVVSEFALVHGRPQRRHGFLLGCAAQQRLDRGGGNAAGFGRQQRGSDKWQRSVLEAKRNNSEQTAHSHICSTVIVSSPFFERLLDGEDPTPLSFAARRCQVRVREGGVRRKEHAEGLEVEGARTNRFEQRLQAHWRAFVRDVAAAAIWLLRSRRWGSRSPPLQERTKLHPFRYGVGHLGQECVRLKQLLVQGGQA